MKKIQFIGGSRCGTVGSFKLLHRRIPSNEEGSNERDSYIKEMTSLLQEEKHRLKLEHEREQMKYHNPDGKRKKSFRFKKDKRR